MFHLNNLWPDGLVWLVLAATVLSLFARPQVWPTMLGITALTALYFSRISLLAVASVALGLTIAKLSQRHKGRYHILCHVLVIIWALFLTLHLIPGFDNLLVVEQAVTGSGSIPFTMYLNLDKPLIVFGLLLLSPTMLKHDGSITRPEIVSLTVLFLALPLIAWGTGIVRPEMSIPDWIWLFMLNNLLFTCVAEEALFRGYIQHSLVQRYSPTVGVGIASFLFGLAHFSGGILFIAVATLAGLLYGIAYHWSGRLVYAVLIHFAFNLVHLLFFTYPLAN
ncbi:hypothetical protein RJ45_09550 [Photobacterium gaetbulicola]|uniref:CAAX prenyl protease 2/Lysostaphin resistance protein A-like domain-containing protein n=1 Tax=Photobacterium gaetbulicola TaxID=1295392 RepID=A0A0B9GYP2_9GAMM|nr:type II CAAX endopeptidase family protein [Photobacterium gaetbulicola]KHT63841.1 hypothetical protein RJ45_09550 [Photobacterium gaetbulicola]